MQQLTVPLRAAQVIDVEVPNSVVLKVRLRRRALLLQRLLMPEPCDGAQVVDTPSNDKGNTASGGALRRIARWRRVRA